jgi:acetyl-CoA acetyltransferase
MGLGPVYATAVALERAGAALRDVQLIEINEAFAAQILAVRQAFASAEFAVNELGLKGALGEINPEITNVNGGAIALGHPLGATGTRLMTTLLCELERTGKRWGLQTMCEGGGQANVTIIERLT